MKPLLIIFFTLLLFSCEENNSPDQNEELIVDKEPAKPQLVVPVEVSIVKYEIVKQSIPLTGILQPISAIDIISETSGKVQQIFRNLGDPVSTRDTLARIDDRVPLSQYHQAQAQVLSAKNNLDIAKLNLSSDKDLFESGDISKLEFENTLLAVKTAEANHLSALASLSLSEKSFLDTRITSPIYGEISRKHIDPGTMVNIGMNLFRVVDYSTLKIEIGVSQKLISLINVGSPAKITISALNGLTVEGKVRHISPQADEQTGTFLVEIHIPNNAKQMKAGMTVSIELTITSDDEKIVIPNHALVTKNGNSFVYKIENGKAQITEVHLSNSIGSKTIIESGISQGDSIVVVGLKSLGMNTPVLIETVHE
ncbi:MAG: efflux RND transporter periplasmic adaptor subunit [Calditrichaeota bacterium]|nr:efflux RND transporter periplasmic adaptor subunit [Calditrichota bacterium]